MLDKLDLRVPRHTEFTARFESLYQDLRAMDRGPIHPSKYYEYAGDLREFGHSVRLNLYCQMDKVGNHKLELIDAGQMSRSEIIQEVEQIFRVNAADLSVMRVDLAVDVPELPVQWFRETVQVQHKHFRSAVTGEPFYCEMGKGDIQTLYFGKRPNLIRIYDKQAEYRDQYRTLVRRLGKDVEPPSFESVFGISNRDSILTRVERQIGGRIPAEVGTFRQLIEPGFDFKPFAKLKIIDHSPMPRLDSTLTFETRCTGLYLRSLAESEGMQAMNSFISKYSNGNASRVREKYRTFLPSASATSGITGEQLQARFERSLALQMFA